MSSTAKSNLDKFVLGTAQLGMSYGIANLSGQPSNEESNAILDLAMSSGVCKIDTAAAYGASEEVIGSCLTKTQKQEICIQTKLGSLTDLAEGVSREAVNKAVEKSIQTSRQRLGLKILPCLLLHRWQHFTQFDGAIWQQLLRLKQQGLIVTLGVSVQSVKEALEALCEPEIELIQLPFNICDWRWRAANFSEAREQRPDVHIQARSSLLQGVFLLSIDKWPELETSQAEEIARTLGMLAKIHNRDSIQDLCFAYSRTVDWIDSIVVGVETVRQLEENIALFSKQHLKTLDDIDRALPRMDDRFLNPNLWNSLNAK